MPAGVAPAGSGVGELASSVRLPPLTANAPTAPILLSLTNRVWPWGLRRARPRRRRRWRRPVCCRAGSAPRRGRSSSGRWCRSRCSRWKCPSRVISTQPGAVCRSAKGRIRSARASRQRNRETLRRCLSRRRRCGRWTQAADVGSPAGTRCRTGPAPARGRAIPARRSDGCPSPTVKLLTSDVPTRVPAILVPSPLNSTSPGCEPPGSVRMEPATGARRPLGWSTKPGVVAAAVTGVWPQTPGRRGWQH